MLQSLPIQCNWNALADNSSTSVGPLHIDYAHFHACVLGEYPLLSFAVLLAWLVFLFYLLGHTADAYFSPTLARISEKCHLRYDLAGVTLLAFGNGAPDVFASLAAFSSGVSETAVNELLGGACFICNVVLGCVALSSTIQVHPWALSRDLGAFVLTLGLLASISRHHSIAAHDWTEVFWAFSFMLMYLVYVLTAIAPEFLYQWWSGQGVPQISRREEDPSMGVLSAFWHEAMTKPDQSDRKGQYAFITRQGAELNGDGANLELSSPVARGVTFNAKIYEDHFPDAGSLFSPLMEQETHDQEALLERVGFSTGASVWESAYWNHLRWRRNLERRVCIEAFEDMGWWRKILLLPIYVFAIARDLTIPIVEEETWSRSLATLHPINASLFLLAVSNGFHWHFKVASLAVPVWLLVLLVALMCSIAISFLTHKSKPPPGWILMILLGLGFASCVGWIYSIANEILVLLMRLGDITGTSNSILGLTVLSWGNSMGDLIADVAVARAGYPEMAIAGCFGGPVFNILVGIGVPMAFAFVRDHDFSFQLDVHAWISLWYLLGSLSATFVVFQAHGFRCPRWYARVMLVGYVLYTIVNVAKVMEWI